MKQMKNQYIYPLRVHIEDTDFGGVVYHSQYLNFMERARSEWLEELGYGIMQQREHHIFIPVCSAKIDFLKPVGVHEKVEVVSTIKSVGAASIIFEQYLRAAQSKAKIFCKAEIKLACVNSHMQARRWPKASIFETIRRTLT